MGSIQRGVSATLQADVSGPTQIALQVAVAEIPGLLLAVVHDLYEGFDTALEEELARQPQGPGAIAKAYVRASIAELRDSKGSMVEHTGILSLLQNVESVTDYAWQQNHKWEARLSDEGLDPEFVQLLLLMIDGVSTRALFGLSVAAEDLANLEARLLNLIDRHADMTTLMNP